MIFKGSNLNGRAFLAIVLIFMVSLAVRWPNLDRPLSKHHEFVTAVSLRVLQIWEDDGGAKFNYVPVMNYPGEANKNINNHASPLGTMKDAEGNYYYVSHPPMAYMLPHIVFKALHVQPTVWSLQWFHLAINFLSGICIYLIAVTLKQTRARSGVDRVGLIAVSIYMGASAVLWFQANTYMSDMLVHFFFLLGILLGLKCVRFPSSAKWKILFAVNLFLMIYTSWLGVFFIVVVVFGGMFLWRKQAGAQLALLSIFIGGVTLWLIYTQYGSVAGKNAFIDHLSQRLEVRGSTDSVEDESFVIRKVKEFGTIIFNYSVNYLPILLLIVGILAFMWKKSISKLKGLRSFILLAGIPIVLLHLALLNYSGHDFTVLYASGFLSIVLALLIEQFSKAKQVVLTLAVVIISIAMYYVMNPPGDFARSGERYDTSMKIGKLIQKNADDHEVVYLQIDQLDPMIVVYAERNIMQVKESFKPERHPFVLIKYDPSKGNKVVHSRDIVIRKR